MKVFSSDSTERRSFGTFMQPSRGYQLGSPESPGYERTARRDPDGRIIFKQQHVEEHRQTRNVDVY
jgi:hypothetical protein